MGKVSGDSHRLGFQTYRGARRARSEAVANVSRSRKCEAQHSNKGQSSEYVNGTHFERRLTKGRTGPRVNQIAWLWYLPSIQGLSSYAYIGSADLFKGILARKRSVKRNHREGKFHNQSAAGKESEYNRHHRTWRGLSVVNGSFTCHIAVQFWRRSVRLHRIDSRWWAFQIPICRHSQSLRNADAMRGTPSWRVHQ